MHINLKGLGNKLDDKHNLLTPHSVFYSNKKFKPSSSLKPTEPRTDRSPKKLKLENSITSSNFKTERMRFYSFNNTLNKEDKQKKSTTIPRCMRFTSDTKNETMMNIRKKIRMNHFIHSQFDPELECDPLLDKIFNENDPEYDENTDKGNTYVMDYIMNNLPKNEVKSLCKKIEHNKVNIKIYQPHK